MISVSHKKKISPSFNSLKCIIALVAALAASHGSAAVNQGLTMSLDGEDQSKWSGVASFGFLSSTMNPKENDYVTQALFSADLSFRVWDRYRAGFGFRGHKDLNNERLNRMSSAYLSINGELYRNEGFHSKLDLAYYIPVDKEELRYDTYRGALAMTPSVGYRWEEGPLRNLTIGGSLTAARRFYRYTSTQGGFPLTKYSLTASIGAGYQLLQNLGLGIQFANTKPWDFDGEAFRSQYSATQTLTYSWSQNLAFSVGHTTGGYTFGYSGVDYDIRFYDRFTSKFFGSVAYSM